MTTSKIPNAGVVETPDLQLLIDSTPGLIHTSLPNGYLDFFNDTWLKYVGRSLEELQGWKWTEYIHPDDLEGIVQKWRASLASGEPFLHETRVRRADGEYRWMLHHKIAIRDEHGEIVKWYGSSIDIEDRKRAEEQLRRSAQELQRKEFYLAEAQRIGHMGTWVFDPAGRFEYWSPELFHIHGLDPANGAPSSEEYLALLHPQDREFMRSIMKRMVLEASGFDVTKRILRPNGELRYIRCVGTPVGDNGVFKRFLGTAMDVTEQEQLTQELKRREAYLTEAQGLSHTGSFGWKPDSGEIVWSEETYRIFDYDRALKPTIDSVVQGAHPHDRALVQQVIDRASQTGTDFEHEYRLLMPDGGVKHVHAIAHALQDASGNREFVGAVTDITERKTAEEKIRRLVDANILGVFVGDVEGECVVDANEAFLRMLQYSREDLVSRRMLWADLTPAEWHKRDERALASLKATGAAQPYEKEFFRKDGSRVPVLVGGALFEGGNEGIAFVLDLSEQKRAQEALRSSEAYLAEAQRLSHTGSFGWKPDRGEIVWTDETYRIFEYDRSITPTMDLIVQRVHPEDRASFQEVINQASVTGTNFEHTYRLLLPDGRVKYFHALAHATQDGSGNVEFLGAGTDITERKNAEERVREREAELRQILNLTPQVVAVFGERRERLYANHVALDYFGLSNEEWLQCSDRSEDVHPDDRERVNDGFDRSLSTGSAYETEMRLRKSDGSYRWFLVRYNPLRDEQGQVTRWYVAATDIEERKQAEERLRDENIALREEVSKASMFEEIVGDSPALQRVLSRISKVAPTTSTVLITGETGTGKELIARAIHHRSRRCSRPFVSVNCAAIPRDLIPSELFGHEKGAFTGALQRRMGKFEWAEGGTIFLDEVGELPAETQIALLRVLQEHEFERVGGNQAIRTDIRVIAATNRDLQAAIAAGTFRSDLFYRLNVFPIEVPPLRKRKDDITMLVEYFIHRYARQAGKKITSIDKKTLELVQAYPWPGNIRELQNVIERSVILCETEIFLVDESWLSRASSSPLEESPTLSKKPTLQEREIIEAALAETRGRVSGSAGAAAKLGIPSTTLESKIKSLKINKHHFKAS